MLTSKIGKKPSSEICKMVNDKKHIPSWIYIIAYQTIGLYL